MTDPTIADEDVEAHLDQLCAMATERPEEMTTEEEVQEAVFRGAFIPRDLNEVRLPFVVLTPCTAPANRCCMERKRLLS